MPPTYHHHLGDVFADLMGHDPPDYCVLVATTSGFQHQQPTT